MLGNRPTNLMVRKRQVRNYRNIDAYGIQISRAIFGYGIDVAVKKEEIKIRSKSWNDITAFLHRNWRTFWSESKGKGNWLIFINSQTSLHEIPNWSIHMSTNT